MRIEHTIDIAAPPEKVWALTVDVESWPELSPTMTAVERLDEGPLRVGSTARVKQPGQRAKVWTVTAVEQGRRFAWASRVFGTDMTATHTLHPTGEGTANTLTIDVTGRASGLVGRVIGGQIHNTLATENAKFKQAAES
ncbi:MAG TPA: SRPBCC family protein [Acidimicrobiales bacterium]